MMLRAVDLLLQLSIFVLVVLVLMQIHQAALPPPPSPQLECVAMHSLQMLSDNASTARTNASCAALDCFHRRLRTELKQRRQSIAALRLQLEALERSELHINASEKLLDTAASAEVAVAVTAWEVQQIDLRRLQIANLLARLT